MIVLNVAEKPSIAKSVTNILSRNYEIEDTKSKYNKLYKFNYNLGGADTEMWFTSVSGHLTQLKYDDKYQSWQQWDPCIILKNAEISTYIPTDKQNLQKNLQNFSKRCNRLILWLDCDREGENIAFEVLNVCKESNPKLEVFRAHFSAVTYPDIMKALNNLQKPDEKLSASVEARQEIDLRIGASFTRFQTLLLRRYFALKEKSVISYGPCQFPTLGFVVQRFKEIDTFVKEEFWYIKCKVGDAEFTWCRGNLFDKMIVLMLFERCYAQQGLVANVISKDVQKWKPYPLSTIEFEKLASKKLKISAHMAMDIAEKLYNQGFISYPRTETNKFPNTMNLKELIEHQKDHPTWGQYAKDLIDYNYDHPKGGNKDDKAHPPIHPVKIMTQNQATSAQEWAVYELITRHFLACCSKNARGSETVITLEVQQENFNKTGLVIKEKNFLEIYPYEVWAQSELPNLKTGEKVKIDMAVKNGLTTPPKPLTEAELIGLMDKNGIGTDATIHEHIKTIQEREYATKYGQVIKPTKLGLALVESYHQLGFTLHLPHLRATMEQRMNNVAQGLSQKEEIISETVDEMLVILKELQQKQQQILETVGGYLEKLRNFDVEQGLIQEEQEEPKKLGLCGVCDQQMILKDKKLHCETCQQVYNLPFNGTPEQRADICPICNFQLVNILIDHGKSYTLCPKCYNSGVQKMTCSQCSNNNCQHHQQTVAEDLFPCNLCHKPIKLRLSKAQKQFMGCSSYPKCKQIIFLPNFVKQVTKTKNVCNKCANPLFKIEFIENEAQIPSSINKNQQFCLHPNCSTEIPLKWHNSSEKETQQESQFGSKSKQQAIFIKTKCRKCFQPGHFEETCPQKTVQTPQFQDLNIKQPKVCPSCGITGRHPKASDCPLKKGKKKQSE